MDPVWSYYQQCYNENMPSASRYIGAQESLEYLAIKYVGHRSGILSILIDLWQMVF